jgi:hypothetical protein
LSSLYFLSLKNNLSYGKPGNTPKQDKTGLLSFDHCISWYTSFPGALYFSSCIAWRCYLIYCNAQMDVLSHRKKKMEKEFDSRFANVSFTYRYFITDRCIDQYAFIKDHFCYSAF